MIPYFPILKYTQKRREGLLDQLDQNSPLFYSKLNQALSLNILQSC